MKKFKQLFVITLCLAIVATAMPSTGDAGIMPLKHFEEDFEKH